MHSQKSEFNLYNLGIRLQIHIFNQLFRLLLNRLSATPFEHLKTELHTKPKRGALFASSDYSRSGLPIKSN